MSGNDNISQPLIKLVQSGNIPHAVLLQGEFCAENADYLAGALVCTSDNISDRPCGECAACRKAKSKNHADIIYLLPQKQSNPYPIDFVREIRTLAYVLPNEASKKVYIFTNADNISVASQNALLKIIEEPPPSVVFIICCNKKEMLLDTVLSRVSVIPCGAAKGEEISSEAAHLSENIAECVFFGSEYDLMKAAYPLIKDKTLFLGVLSALRNIFRTVYYYKCGALTGDLSEISQKICENATISAVLLCCKAVDEAADNISKNANAQLNVTRFCAALKSAAGK